MFKSENQNYENAVCVLSLCSSTEKKISLIETLGYCISFDYYIIQYDFITWIMETN